MSAIYDNWERLVAAALKKQQLWELFHAQSRSPSILSEASDLTSSFHLSSPILNLSDFSSPGSLPKPQRVLPNLFLISDFGPAFDIKDVYLASAELLGRGTFGSAYAAEMNNGVKIVVKRLNPVIVSEMVFKRRMEIVGDIRHENVAALRAYYSSEDEKLMLHDYYSGGSVSALLHGQIGESPALVDWETRIRIGIGAARGIAEIHTHEYGMLVHGNIKSSNIFLNQMQYGCVSDLGMANIIATTFIPTARCYAPEVKNTQNVSQASDVYSFGVLLFELLTRKSPMCVPGGPQAVNLVKLVKSVKSKALTAKVFDADLLKDPTIREQIVKVLQIGISCIAKSPKRRPKMSDVVKMLEDLTKMSPRISSPRERKLIFVEDGNPTFAIEDMLSASADFLGRGTFGSSYKATFEDGNSIRVKRMYVNVAFSDSQKHMEIIGQIKHENITELRAYCSSKDEVLAVYDFYNQPSLSDLLHGQRSTGSSPLDWDARLKIAIGAARGVAHIHRQYGGMLVHGNIKSSNIFTNGEEYVAVSDVGCAKVASIVPYKKQTKGNSAPELHNYRKASQACDAFSFGVVLLELLSRKPSEHTMENGKVVSLRDWVLPLIGDEWRSNVLDAELRGDVKNEKAMMHRCCK